MDRKGTPRSDNFRASKQGTEQGRRNDWSERPTTSLWSADRRRLVTITLLRQTRSRLLLVILLETPKRQTAYWHTPWMPRPHGGPESPGAAPSGRRLVAVSPVGALENQGDPRRLVWAAFPGPFLLLVMLIGVYHDIAGDLPSE